MTEVGARLEGLKKDEQSNLKDLNKESNSMERLLNTRNVLLQKKSDCVIKIQVITTCETHGLALIMSVGARTRDCQCVSSSNAYICLCARALSLSRHFYRFSYHRRLSYYHHDWYYQHLRHDFTRSWVLFLEI